MVEAQLGVLTLPAYASLCYKGVSDVTANVNQNLFLRLLSLIS